MIKNTTIWPGNINRYLHSLQAGDIYGVAKLKDGRIAAEVRYSQKMRLIIVADPLNFEITHRCHSDNEKSDTMTCWHLAAGLDLIAFSTNNRIILDGKKPVATVRAVYRHVMPEEIKGCRDYTREFFQLKGLTARDGEFKLIQFEEGTDVPEIAFHKEKRKRTGIVSRLLRLLIPALFTGWC